MERIQNKDTAYQDDSQRTSLTPARFTMGTARRARQVVALRTDLMRPFHRLWASLGARSHRAKLLAGIVLVALAGGVAGVFLATANNNHETGVDAGSLRVGAEARTQNDNLQPISKAKEPEPKSQPADRGTPAEFEGPEMERAIVELQKRRAPSRAKKAYRVAVIYPGTYDSSRGRKRGGKH